MTVRYIDICIPFTPPQRIEVKEFANKRYVCKIVDKWERSLVYQGIDLGFGITLFKNTYDTSALLLFNWEQAIYTDGRGKPWTIDIYCHESYTQENT